AIGRFLYRLRSGDKVFAEASYYRGYSIQRVSPTPVNSLFTSTPMTLPPSSPYYPAAFVRSIGGDPTLPVHVLYRTIEIGPRVEDVTIDQWRAVAGLLGTRWGWDYQAAMSYTGNRQVPFHVSGELSETAFGPLLRSGVVNP